MTQYGFHFDSSRCTGCRTCEMACKDFKELDQTIAFRKVYDYEGGTWTAHETGSFTNDAYAYHLSIACNHCDSPACMAACPTGAINKDKTTGIVRIDETVCVGDGACTKACPYNAPTVDPEKGRGVKCDLCYDRVTNGKNPICVDSCPLRAIDFGDIEDLRAKYGTSAAIAPMPLPDQTKPNITITESPAAKEPGDKTGAIANLKEVTGIPAA